VTAVRASLVNVGHAAAVHEGLRDAGQQQMRVGGAVREAEFDGAGARRAPVLIVGMIGIRTGPCGCSGPTSRRWGLLALAEAHERIAAAVAEGHHGGAVRDQPPMSHFASGVRLPSPAV